MPIIANPSTLPPTIPPPGKINVQVTNPTYRSSIVDTKVQSVGSLMTNIIGSTWIVDYYSQVIGGDESLESLDLTQTAPYQQYYWLHGFHLKLQSSLQPGTDNVTGQMTLSGDAVVYPNTFIPNKGDVIVGDIGNGNAGQFTVTDVTKKTLMKETTYEIHFELTRQWNNALQAHIESKVVKEAWFSEDMLLDGQLPLLSEEDNLSMVAANALVLEMLSEWLTMFYSHDLSTLVVGGQCPVTYDPFVTSAILRLFDSNEHPLLQKIKQLNVDGNNHKGYTSVWDLLLDQSFHLWPYVFTRTEAVDVRSFQWLGLYSSIRYSGFKRVVWPINNPSTADTCCGGSVMLAGDKLTPSEPLLPPLEQTETVPLVGVTDCYLFTNGFYESKVGTTALEKLVQAYIGKNAVTISSILDIANKRHRWGLVEKYYHYPLVMLLLKAAIRSL